MHENTVSNINNGGCPLQLNANFTHRMVTHDGKSSGTSMRPFLLQSTMFPRQLHDLGQRMCSAAIVLRSKYEIQTTKAAQTHNILAAMLPESLACAGSQGDYFRGFCTSPLSDHRCTRPSQKSEAISSLYESMFAVHFRSFF